MEIPTDKIIEVIKAVTSGDAQHDVIEVIKAQAREILDLQATIVRLKDEFRISNNLRNEFPEPGCWTGRISDGE